MKRRLALWLALCLTAVLSAAPLAQAGTAVRQAPVPTKAPSGEITIMGTPGTWYVGATPPNVSYTKPVLVFVHGKSGQASDWWTDTVYHGHNDMYDYAYANGYRTAFVDMYGDKDMWVNGQLLAGQINAIASYFGVSKVTVIAHSKGGVDANAASAWYGANSQIKRVVTLSSPHWGTPLADMAYSTWTWWLAELLGERSDATYVLQTGYMSYFRSITDGLDSAVPYYTLSGNKCGPIGTALWVSCGFISGQDDGMVPVWSARKPGDIFVKDGYWDHDEIRMGSRSWAYFSPYIQTAATGSPAVAGVGPLLAAAPGQATDAGRGAAPAAPGNVILRGGDTVGTPAPAFPLESGVRSGTFTIYSSSPDFTAALAGPDGSTYRIATTAPAPAEDVFAGAWMGTVQVGTPAAGQWQLTAAAPQPAGYLMVATLDSDLKATLAMDKPVATPGGTQALTVGFGSGRAPKSSHASAAVAVSGQQPHGRPAFAPANGLQKATVAVPAGNAMHNVTVTVTGALADGTAFERTLVSSFAAVAPQDRGTWHGR